MNRFFEFSSPLLLLSFMRGAKKGLLHIYTGGGQGKTTAAVGLCVRAKSRGLKVLFAQFMKSLQGGETDLLKELSIEVIRFKKVRSPLFYPDENKTLLREESLKALSTLKTILHKYDLVVIDEFNHLLSNRLLKPSDARRFILDRPKGLTMALTGRNAPKWLIEMADLVTEMKEIKHPISSGAGARRGMEF